MLKYGQALPPYPIGHRDSWRKIPITLIEGGGPLQVNECKRLFSPAIN